MNPERWKRLDQLLQQALSQPPASRKPFLDEACAGDEELLREVQSLLEHDEKAGDFIAMPPDELAAGLFAKEPTDLPPGTRIASYKIEALLGRGGMGVVYRARDDRLDRNVALKVLPDTFAGEPERVARFKREAKAVAALSHPNILAIYEFGNVEGLTFAAMELLEGDTLRAGLKEGALPTRKVIDYGVQIAQGLSAAHERGIVHRDLKPENLFITKDGRVKILDFGLAKLRSEPGSDKASAPSSTEPGVVMGTVGYMSPEQVRGKDADARSDIFALGAILYEMLSGRRAFQGDSEADIISAILREDPPDLAYLDTRVSPAIKGVVRRCLEKNPDERFQSARDLGFALEAANTLSAQTRADRIAMRRKSLNRRYYIVAAAAVTLVAAALALMYRTKPSLPLSQTVAVTSFEGDEYSPSFSPDGNQIAFTWNGENQDNMDVYVMPVGGATPLRLTTDPVDDLFPAWSPDGREIALIRYTKNKSAIFTVSPLGGPERKLAEGIIGLAILGNRMSWASDGKHLAFTYKGSQQEPWSIYSLSMDSLEKKRLTSPPANSFGDLSPAFSPDGSHLGFLRAQSVVVMDIYVIPSSGGEPRRLTADAQEIMGICWTTDSREIVFPHNRTGTTTLWKIPVAGGSPQPVQGIGEDAIEPTISAKGDRLAYMNTSGGHLDIYRIDLTGSDESMRSSSKLIASTRSQGSPWISPDGSRIAFASHRSRRPQIWTCNGDGTHPIQLTNLSVDSVGSPSWSPDGQLIAFDSTLARNSDIFVISPEAREPRQVTTESSEDFVPSWSRDGRWIYFGSNRSGEFQVWKTSIDGGKAVQVTKNGGFWGQESMDGEFLYFAKQFENTGIWRVPVEGGPETLVLDRVVSWGAWTLTERGIYFRNEDTKPRPSIEFFDFATQQVTRIALVREGLTVFGTARWLSVSPDGKWLVYHGGRRNSDIMMVENFR